MIAILGLAGIFITAWVLAVKFDDVVGDDNEE